MSESAEMQAARDAMIAKRFGATASQMGGKGTMRRKHKTAARSNTSDTDKKLQTAFKKLGATVIPGIEEVNLFRDDGKIVHFNAPKVSASTAANTYCVSGNAEVKTIAELLPGIVTQLGQENLAMLQNQFAQAQGGAAPVAEEDSDDDDVPDLVEGQDFEEVAA
jgi:nascent polypeptide-associated complex subunit beta